MDYEDMLDRGISETPDIEAASSRFDVPEPEIRQEGNTTVVENFQAIGDTLGRSEDHLLQFLQNDLGTSAHIDESGRGRFTGEFRASRIADAVEDYTTAFVICPECGLPDTTFERDQGALVLRCEACGARSPAVE